jgi:6-phosphogluconate dehydrogenase
MIGLGRMGGNMARRLLRGGHQVVGFNRSPQETKKVESEGAIGAYSLEEVVSNLEPPRVAWSMVPAGGPTEEIVKKLGDLLSPGDIVVDGGNSHYTDSMKRAKALEEKDISFVDAGTSGGIWGLTEGYCLMVGAQPDAFTTLEPALKTLAPENGYALVGPPGAGHFTKMVHNGVEYALMQGYAEGFEILKGSQFDLDLAQIANLWRQGSVVRSWLLDLAASALEKDPQLSELAPYVEDSGEGRWTVESAINESVPAPAIAAALFARFASRQDDSFALKLLAALRQEFGGHAVRPDKTPGTKD